MAGVQLGDRLQTLVDALVDAVLIAPALRVCGPPRLSIGTGVESLFVQTGFPRQNP